MAGENEDQTEVTQQPDDGFTAEERAQFDAMRTGADVPADAGDSGQSVDAGAAEGGAGAGEGAGAAAARADSGADAGDDGDDEADAGQQAGQQSGQEAKPPKRVRYEKFKRAQDEADALRKQLGERDERYSRLDERMRIINEALTPKQKEEGQKADEDPEPDPDEDLFEHSKWQKRRIDRLEARLGEFDNSRQQEAAAATVQRAYEDDAHAFIRQEPNFVPAYNFLMGNRIAELALYYFDKDVTVEGSGLLPQELAKIRSTINAEERELVASALQSGRSPTARIFALARARGFRPPAPQQQQQNGNGAANGAANGKGNGHAQNGAAPGNLAAEAEKAERGHPVNGQTKPNGGQANVREEIERVKRGSEAGLSLSQGGGAPAMTLSPERIADMSQDEFNALMDQLSPAEVRRAMGG